MIRNIFIKDIPTKLFSIFASLILWFIVSANSSAILTYPTKIPIKTVNLKPGLVAILDQQEVQIKINSSGVNLAKLSSDNFEATVDLKDEVGGVYEKEVSVTSLNSEIKILDIKPRKITVQIEKQISKNVPVQVITEGKAAEGYSPTDSIATPSEVKITGPETLINNTSEVLAKIKLSGEKEGISVQSNIYSYDSQGNIIKSIIIEPRTVKVDISITKSGDRKSVAIKTKFKGSLGETHQISSVTTDPQTVTLIGDPIKTEQVKSLETEPIDLNQISSDTVITTRLVIPNGLSIEEQNLIKVKIIVSQANILEEISLSPNISNLTPGFVAKEIDPGKVKLIIQYAKNVQSDLGKITFSIDGKSLKKGENIIAISKNNFILPPSIEIVSITQELIKIMIAD